MANVYELYEHPVHRALTGASTGTRAALEGESQAEAQRACEAISHLLLCGNELRAVVGRARALREGLPLLFREEKMREIERLLTGPSIRLPDTDVPLTQRGLLSSAVADGRALSLQEMLDRMIPVFEAAKRTVFEVDHLWSTLPVRMDAAEAEWVRLRGIGEEASGLPDLRRQIEAVRSQGKSDPLGAIRTLEQELLPALARARAGVETATADRRQAEADLARAHTLQAELRETHARAMVIAEEREHKVAVAASALPPLPLTTTQVEDAGRWLARLDAMMAQPANRASVKVGARRWLDEARQHLDHEQTVIRANQALLDERQELRGRLDALTAKAAGSGWAEDTALADGARAARALLYRRPTPLEQARELVARYQTTLHARTTGGT